MAKKGELKKQASEIIAMYNDGKSTVEIAKLLNACDTGILKILKQFNCKIRTKKECSTIYTLNENYFEKIDTPRKAYWLGFLYADGYNNETHHTVRLSLQKIGRAHV